MKVRLKDKFKLFLSPLSSRVEPEEPLARFVYDRSKLKPSTSQLKHTAFQPPKAYPTEISVYRTVNCADREVWNLSSYVTDTKQPLGYGVLNCSSIKSLDKQSENVEEQSQLESVSLDVLSSPRPHYRHANIVNIPKAETPIEKARQKLVRMKLSQNSILILRESIDS